MESVRKLKLNSLITKYINLFFKLGTMPTNCSNQYAVYNIDKINLDKIVPGGFSYVNGADHSKWAANLALNDQSSKYACVGDINRQTSQFSRGGGTVCFNNNQNVWSLYYNLIDLTENCQLSSVSPKSL
jgi:deoxyribonuclease-2